MRFFENSNHAFRETTLLFRTNLMTNLLSLLSTTLIFLFLALIFVGWKTSSHWISLLQDGAEIQIFEKRVSEKESTIDTAAESVSSLLPAIENQSFTSKIAQISGVKEVSFITASEAQIRMTALMGDNADLLLQLDKNPFEAFYEAKIDINLADDIIKAISSIPEVERFRDNRDILKRLQDIETAMKTIGMIIAIAVSLLTFVLVSHIIRTGVEMNKSQIKTLRLLGAPESHIAIPFYLLGFLLTIGGALVATVLAITSLQILWDHLASPLPFLPLPSIPSVTSNLTIILLSIAIILAISGTRSGLSAAKKYRS